MDKSIGYQIVRRHATWIAFLSNSFAKCEEQTKNKTSRFPAFGSRYFLGTQLP